MLFGGVRVREALPTSDYADTEVSTNLTLRGDNEWHGVGCQVSLLADAAANLEVWIGVDADEDGSLSLDEAEAVVGFDCGSWFRRDREGVRKVAETHRGRVGKTFDVRARELTAKPDLLRVVRRGTAVQDEQVFCWIDRGSLSIVIR